MIASARSTCRRPVEVEKVGGDECGIGAPGVDKIAMRRC
jgi:hypothetical protein